MFEHVPRGLGSLREKKIGEADIIGGGTTEARGWSGNHEGSLVSALGMGDGIRKKKGGKRLTVRPVR